MHNLGCWVLALVSLLLMSIKPKQW